MYFLMFKKNRFYTFGQAQYVFLCLYYILKAWIDLDDASGRGAVCVS